MRIGLLSGLKDALCDILPSCMQCCRSSRNDRGLTKGRDKLAQETNIIKLIQQRRYFNAALKQLLPKEQRLKLKEQSRIWVLRLKNKDEKFGREAD